MFNWNGINKKPDVMKNVDVMIRDGSSKRNISAFINNNNEWVDAHSGNIIDNSNVIAWKEPTIYFQ